MGSVHIWTQRADAWFDIPFTCSACGFHGHAKARGEGSASTATEPHMLEELARKSAYSQAWQLASESACPRCGGESTVLRERKQAWQKSVKPRKTIRSVVGGLGLFLVLGSTGGCSTLYEHPGSADALRGLAIWGGFWSMLVVVIVVALSPGGEPKGGIATPRVVFP